MEITLATKITIARMFLIIPTVVFYVVGMYVDKVYLAFMIVTAILYTILCSTDFVDGNLARKTNTVSDLGKFLDPLADKIIIVVMLFLIVYFNDGLDYVFVGNGLVISLLGGLILSRELMVSVFRAIAAKKGIVLAADVFGKIKTVFLDIGVAALLIAGLHPVISWIGTLTYYIGAIFAVFSGFNYIIKNKQVFVVEKSKTEDSNNNGQSEIK